MKLNWLGVCIAWCAAAVTAADDGVDYARDVKPILARHCYQCHGPDEQEADLRLDTAAAALAGGISGAAIVPGKSDESLLVLALQGGSDDVSRMPPEDAAEPLPDDQVALIRRWIDQGAAHPADEKPAAATAKSSQHWSFQPLHRPALPDLADAAAARGGIDRFVLARLQSQGIAPSPEADRATLIRRLSLDLLGLPPTVDEVERFLADPRPDAYERLVDRLLASPRYGERWGRHWLDLARYADSDGYTNDVARVMWSYRDWVVDAVNRDLPFDRFTIEQLAGDLLPGATQDQIIATGFHRNTQRNREGGSDAEQYRVEAVVDRVSTTGVVFMGLTLGCARCHDHKYDPVSQSEFYRLFAFLNSQDEPELRVPRPGPQYAELEQLRQEIAAADRQLKELEAQKKAEPPAAAEATGEAEPSDQAGSADDARRAELTGQLEKLRQREKELAAAATTTTLVMRERSQPRETFVHIRGDFLRKGKPVTAGVPAVLPPLPADLQNPNRLDLARWLVSDQQPLTPRVTVNRIWQHFFGQGLVETENDFGTQGARPTHPLLLDWLAAEFVESGWNVKRLQRRIVTSGTYRQASRVRADLAQLDPHNRLLARQNRLRLEAEAIRDSALAAAGLLSGKMHGPGVFPPQPDGVMKMTRNPNRKWVTSTGADRYRRGVYTYFWRSTPYPFLKLFNAPESNTTCTRRDRSNTPLQALALLNDEAFIEAAQALAVRVLREAPSSDPAARMALMFRLCLARAPQPAEAAALAELWQAEVAGGAVAAGDDAPPRFAAAAWLPAGVDDAQLAAWTALARVLLNVDEFITRE